jgi:hypothetical protein
MTGVRMGLWSRAVLLLEELLVADGGESGSLVDDRGNIDPLVDGDDLVNGGRGDGFSLDNGLDWACQRNQR